MRIGRTLSAGSPDAANACAAPRIHLDRRRLKKAVAAPAPPHRGADRPQSGNRGLSRGSVFGIENPQESGNRWRGIFTDHSQSINGSGLKIGIIECGDQRRHGTARCEGPACPASEQSTVANLRRPALSRGRTTTPRPEPSPFAGPKRVDRQWRTRRALRRPAPCACVKERSRIGIAVQASAASRSMNSSGVAGSRFRSASACRSARSRTETAGGPIRLNGRRPALRPGHFSQEPAEIFDDIILKAPAAAGPSSQRYDATRSRRPESSERSAALKTRMNSVSSGSTAPSAAAHAALRTMVRWSWQSAGNAAGRQRDCAIRRVAPPRPPDLGTQRTQPVDQGRHDLGRRAWRGG